MDRVDKDKLGKLDIKKGKEPRCLAVCLVQNVFCFKTKKYLNASKTE